MYFVKRFQSIAIAYYVCLSVINVNVVKRSRIETRRSVETLLSAKISDDNGLSNVCYITSIFALDNIGS